MVTVDGFTDLLDLVRATTKREAERCARRLTVTRQAFNELIVHAQNHGFSHRLEHEDHIPEPRREKLKSFWADIDDPSRFASAIGNLDSLFNERKYVVIHLFAPLEVRAAGEFHIFYFDQRDLVENGNHWREGEHVHYTSHLYLPNLPCGQVLQKLRQRGRGSISGEHLKTADLVGRRNPKSG